MIGAHGAGETPDTIPNSEAKPSSGDDTLYGESSTVPNYIKDFVYARSFIFDRATIPKLKLVIKLKLRLQF